MVEYSLAKAEVEGSSPFFRLGFSFFSSVLQKSMKNLFFFLSNLFSVPEESSQQKQASISMREANRNHLSF